MEIVILNPSKDAKRFVGQKVEGFLSKPQRLVMTDGTILLVKRIERDADGQPCRAVVEMPPRDVSEN